MNELEPAYRYRMLVTHVTDGDTLRGHIDLGMGVWLHDRTLRLLGINAREMKGDSRAQGMLDRDYLKSLLCRFELNQQNPGDEDREIIVETKLDKKHVAEGDKYGRLLAIVWGRRDGQPINLNQQMLADGFAVPAPESWSK